jgi:hypothetical protein
LQREAKSRLDLVRIGQRRCRASAQNHLMRAKSGGSREGRPPTALSARPARTHTTQASRPQQQAKDAATDTATTHQPTERQQPQIDSTRKPPVGSWNAARPKPERRNSLQREAVSRLDLVRIGQRRCRASAQNHLMRAKSGGSREGRPPTALSARPARTHTNQLNESEQRERQRQRQRQRPRQKQSQRSAPD